MRHGDMIYKSDYETSIDRQINSSVSPVSFSFVSKWTREGKEEKRTRRNERANEMNRPWIYKRYTASPGTGNG